MKKIDQKVLIIPPYISTNWSQVQTLFVRDGVLYVLLNEGEPIAIPNLSQEEIEKVFVAHASFLEAVDEHSTDKEVRQSPLFMIPGMNPQKENLFRVSFGTMDQLGNMMQHNPEQFDAPDLPKEVVEKISSVAKIFAPEEKENLPQPEPHCNCIYCQIMRAMHPKNNSDIEIEEIVSDEELQFCQWEIESGDSKIFTVKNRIDSDESYKVCLDPVGCTCGKEGCEHIIAVLKS